MLQKYEAKNLGVYDNSLTEPAAICFATSCDNAILIADMLNVTISNDDKSVHHLFDRKTKGHTRIINVLQYEGIETVGQLKKLSYSDLIKLPTLGAMSIETITKTLKDL